METTIDLKKKIHDFIDQADERILKIFYAIISTEKSNELELTLEHKAILDERLEEHRKNPIAGKSWSVVKKSLEKDYGL